MVLAHNFSEGQRTRDVQISQDVTFDTMLLTSNTLQGLKNSGFYKPSPIQLHGIPLGKCGFDLLLDAKSGTGKTAVFSVIALEKLDLAKGLQVVMLAPTREIAAQICDVIKHIGSSYEGLKVEVVMGGLPLQDDIVKFTKKRNVHIVVGSPGRLRHLINDKHIDVSSVRLLVFDEADKLMEKSFQADINYIFYTLPKQKQVIMSSATYPENAKPFIKLYVQSAQHICPDSDSILLGIEQKVTFVTHNSNIVRQTKYRFEELLKILSKKQFKQCLIFCNYQARVAELHKMLTREKWPAEQLYGQQEQTDRLDALKTLQEYKCRILISTDLAARGIDASNVDLVINFEPPFEWQTYLHRIGRAGRFGSYGIAVSIVSEGKEQKRFTEMMKSINASLNLGDLWNDEKLDLDHEIASLSSSETQTKVSEHTKPGNKYETLWKIYTSETTQDVVEIESFEELCKSFEKTNKIPIESFTDLLSSFETYEQTSKNYEATYCHLKMPPTLVRENFICIDPCGANSLKIEKACNNTFTTRYSDINQDQPNIRNETVKEKCTYSKELLEKIKDKVEHSDYELENKDDLVSAGLPTAFSSTKHTNHNGRCKGIHVTGTKHLDSHVGHSEKIKSFNKEDRSKHVVKDSNVWKPSDNSKPFDNSNKKNTKLNIQSAHNQNYSDAGEKSDYKHNRSKHGDKNYNVKVVNHNEDTKPLYYNYHNKYMKPKVQSSRVQNETDSDEGEDYGYNTLSQQYTKSQSNTYSASSSKGTKNNSHGNHRSQDYDHESPGHSYGLSQKYINWYSQLKYRVKQIELAIYLDEMSKM